MDDDSSEARLCAFILIELRQPLAIINVDLARYISVMEDLDLLLQESLVFCDCWLNCLLHYFEITLSALHIHLRFHEFDKTLHELVNKV